LDIILKVKEVFMVCNIIGVVVYTSCCEMISASRIGRSIGLQLILAEGLLSSIFTAGTRVEARVEAGRFLEATGYR
jgi:hypothetical protein